MFRQIQAFLTCFNFKSFPKKNLTVKTDPLPISPLPDSGLLAFLLVAGPHHKGPRGGGEPSTLTFFPIIKTYKHII